MALLLGGLAAASEMPFELAFRHNSLVRGQRVAVSTDGKHLAYVVSIPSGSGAARRVVLTSADGGGQVTVSPEEGQCGQPSFSRDGARLAFYCERQGATDLWIHDVESNAARKVDARGMSLLARIDYPLWSAAGDEVLVYAAPADSNAAAPEWAARSLVSVYRAGAERPADSSPAEDWAPPAITARLRGDSLVSARLVAISVATGAARVVSSALRPVPNSLSLSSGGKWIAVSDWFQLSVMSVESGAVGDADTRGGTAGIWHPSREQIYWVSDGRLQSADLSGGAAPVASGLTQVTGALAITRDGGTLISTAPSLKLIAVPLSGGEPHDVVLPDGHEFVQLVTQGAGRLWQTSPDTLTVVTRQVEDGQAAIAQVDLRSGRSKIVWRGLSTLDFVGASADQSQLFGLYEDIAAPPNLYRFSTSLISRKRVSQVEPRFTGLQLARAETLQVTVPQHDGTRTRATAALLLPPGAKRGDRLPTVAVIYPRTTHVGEAARFGGGRPASVPSSLLTTRGYAVLLTSLSAFPENTTGDLSVTLLDALLPQVQAAVALGYTDPDRVAVMGLSFGAFSTALVASATNTFRAGICIAGIYDLTYAATGATSFLPGGDAPRLAPALKTWYGLSEHPWLDMTRVTDASPFFRADRIRTPLLIMHTERDATPVEDARKMFNALRLLGRTAQYAEYAGGGHGMPGWSPPAAVDGGQRILAFLDEYVRAPVRTTPQTPLRAAP